MLTFEVTSFDISYNRILGTPFLFKFMRVIHTAYAAMKMSTLKGIITIKANQRDELACENASLSHIGRFGKKAAQEQAVKVAKTKGGGTPSKASTSMPPINNTPRATPASKGTNIVSGSTPSPVNQKADNKLKGTAGTEDKEVLVDPRNPDKKLWISLNLDPK
jgi:hypothetical protein